MALDSFRALRRLEERLVTLERDLGGLSRLRPGVLGASDYGCCSDKGCCEDKGCCHDKKFGDLYGEEIEDLAQRLKVPVRELIAKILALDPKLLGAR